MLRGSGLQEVAGTGEGRLGPFIQEARGAQVRPINHINEHTGENHQRDEKGAQKTQEKTGNDQTTDHNVQHKLSNP